LASKNINPLASLARIFFPLADPFYIFGQLFSDLASEYSELLASLASVLKNVSTSLLCVFVYVAGSVCFASVFAGVFNWPRY
jgi:hypothetical protein